MRVHITGNAGAGKSTFARALGDALSVDPVSLDSIVWQSNWKPTPPEERRSQELALVEQSAWIIEGVSQLAREHADVIVFLDVPKHICLYRSITRALRHGLGQRPELPDHCPEYKMIPKLPRLIWRFHKHARPKILSDLESQSQSKHCHHVRTKGQRAEALAKILRISQS